MASRAETDGRLAYVLDVLTETPGLTASELALRADTTVRKVRHDLQKLKGAGLARDERATFRTRDKQVWYPTLPDMTEDPDHV